MTLDFLDPGGAATGKLLPTGRPVDTIATASGEFFEVSLIDAASPTVFVPAGDVGCTSMENPSDLDANADLMSRMDEIRRAGAVAMGMAESTDKVALSSPKVAMIAPPSEFAALDGRQHDPADYDIAVRLISMGNFHKALTISGANCVAVAAQVPGSLLNAIAPDKDTLRIGNPSGILPVSAKVDASSEPPVARSATTYRTYRRIMEGSVLYPAKRLEAAE